MDVLQDIAYIITRYKVREVDVITNSPQKKSGKTENRYWEFYVGLRENRWKDEEEAARYFGMEPASKQFNRFKNELKKRLLNTLFFIDVNTSDFNELSRANHELIKEWCSSKILLKRGANRAFLNMANKCLKAAQKFENVTMVVEIVRTIKNLIVVFPGLHKEVPKLDKILKEYQKAMFAEITIQNAYDSFLYLVVGQKGYKKSLAPVAEQILNEYAPLAKEHDHVLLQTCYRTIKLYSKTLLHDWQGGLDIAEEAVDYFKTKPFVSVSYLGLFIHQKISCLTMLKRYEEAKSLADEYLTSINEGFTQWFKNRELATVNSIYSKSYKEAWEICKAVMRHTRFSEIPAMDQESWRVYQGYLLLLARMKKIPLSAREKGDLPKFRLQAWLNDLPLYGQDKRGANIPVLILQAMFLLVERRWDEYDNRVEALRKYRQRHLDPDSEHFRTDCFIRMLELVPKHAHAPETLREAAGPWLDKMASVSVDILDRTFEIEVMPYEDQWAWVMEAVEMPQMFEEDESPYLTSQPGEDKEKASLLFSETSFSSAIADKVRI